MLSSFACSPPRVGSRYILPSRTRTTISSLDQTSFITTNSAQYRYCPTGQHQFTISHIYVPIWHQTSPPKPRHSIPRSLLDKHKTLSPFRTTSTTHFHHTQTATMTGGKRTFIVLVIATITSFVGKVFWDGKYKASPKKEAKKKAKKYRGSGYKPARHENYDADACRGSYFDD